MSKPRLYIAGPMTGLPELNFPAFHNAAAEWRAAGWDVVNPAECFGGDTTRPYRDYVEKDLEFLKTCAAIFMLPGWDGPNARGSVWEYHVAKMLGIHVFYLPMVVRASIFLEAQHRHQESVLEEAERITKGARQADYGHPIEDFGRTGRIWGAILGIPDVTAEQVALCMVGVKMSREVNKPKRDNRVDMAGYTNTLQMIREKRGEG